MNPNPLTRDDASPEAVENWRAKNSQARSKRRRREVEEGTWRNPALWDWAVSAGEPSAVTLVRFGAASHGVWAAVGGLVAACGVLVLGGLRRWARRARV